MRLNWFLPRLRKADRAQPGRLRRVLKVLGPTWLASPVRRIVQTSMFLLFLFLLYYVCWPYGARPAAVWHGWLPVDVDAASGDVTLSTDQPPADPIAPGRVLFISETDGDQVHLLGRFRVQSAADAELHLVLLDPPDAEQLDRLSASLGPWSLSEKDPGEWPSHYADRLDARERIAAESFLVIDPLVSISTALAGRWLVWSLLPAAVILAFSLFVPRGFCAYACPLGTLIDLFDWSIGSRVRSFRVRQRGWWTQIKYFLLLAVLAASLCGVLVSGFVAAIPVVTRGLVFLASPAVLGLTRGWHQVPPIQAGQIVSILLFLAVLGLGLLGPRFWCRYVCPSGVVFSIGNLLRLTERKVEADCTRCGRCVEICPFDAIQPDFTTRGADCTFCQTCGAVCPTRSIKFVSRWDGENLKPADDAVQDGANPGRRRFLVSGVCALAAGAGGAAAAVLLRTPGANAASTDGSPVVRPPGSVPEELFLQLCIRCGECFQACPNNVLQPQGFALGAEGLWAPRVAADWSGCEPSCSRCGQVCPTGAIRALPIAEKRVARMGLAVVDPAACLPHAQREACQLCVDECATAGYDAIEFTKVGTMTDPFGEPIPESGFLAPVVLPEKCVGCGLCQTRCYAVNHKTKGLLAQSAIRVEAGPGREDRIAHGSYVALREEEQRQRQAEQPPSSQPGGSQGSYLPDFLK